MREANLLAPSEGPASPLRLRAFQDWGLRAEVTLVLWGHQFSGLDGPRKKGEVQA